MYLRQTYPRRPCKTNDRMDECFKCITSDASHKEKNNNQMHANALRKHIRLASLTSGLPPAPPMISAAGVHNLHTQKKRTIKNPQSASTNLGAYLVFTQTLFNLPFALSLPFSFILFFCCSTIIMFFFLSFLSGQHPWGRREGKGRVVSFPIDH